MTTPLPSFDEAAEKPENGTAGPLDIFIHENGPSEKDDTAQFRMELKNVLDSAGGAPAAGSGMLGHTIAGELRAMQQPTRTVLERIPADKLAWKPHERSMTIGRLGMHVAELPHWIVRSFELSEFDFASGTFTPNVPTQAQEILDMQDAVWAKAIGLLENASDEELAVTWSLKRAGHTIWSLPRAVIARREMFHITHHRGQLTVFLRLLDVPVPELFGPTADTRR